jgi:choline dehydrogenase-like flavoprotein
LSAPDFQVHAAPVLFVDDGLAPADEDAFIAGACLLRPTSRGRVSLRSALPAAKPRILHNYLTTTEDLATMVRAVRLLMDITARPALAPHRGEALRVPASDREDDILRHIRRTAHTLYHPAGTCAIGQVVDAELRVHGVAGLRVVDASVMPDLVRGNTNAPTIMIAERAADLLRDQAPAPMVARATLV